MTYSRPWTWEDFYAAYGELDEMLASVSHKVNLMIDIRHAGFPPPGAPQHFKRVTQAKHPNVQTVIFVGLPLVVRGFIGILATSRKHEMGYFQFAATPEAARNQLAQQQMSE